MKGPFANRGEAGLALGKQLAGRYANRPDVLVLGLPRGGVPVAYELARALDAPLDLFMVRKLGTPGHEELAMGAIASGDLVVINQDVVDSMKIPRSEIYAELIRERAELKRRETLYRGDRPRPGLRGKVVILVDDGLATGSTMRAAVSAARQDEPSRIVVAVPVGPASACEEFRELADECVCAIIPEPFRAVGYWYEDFSQTTDDEVKRLLEQAADANADAS
ncbi:MAG: phosphoribosyl transferase [Planctomycetes bacterium SCN 63-9]|mgnify:CR=1 FL=1|nr:MAG: phosphoribosyl transferase [Planctomycetes bacterium SCN 63-9]